MTDEDRIPPQALDIEKTVLGTVLYDAAAAIKVRTILLDDCFYASQNTVIWSCICCMLDDGKPLDVLTVAEELRKKNQLEAVGAEPYLSELVSSVATVSNIETHCRILIEKSILRKTIIHCLNLIERAYSGESPETVVKSVSEISNDLNNRLDEAEIGSGGQVKILSAVDLAPITRKYHQEGEQAQVFELKSLPNLAQLYKPALGFLNVWTGIPSHGKALDINTNILTKTGFKKMVDIHVGEIIYDDKGKETKVVFETPVMINHPCFRVCFDDGSEIIADEEHIWKTISEKARRSEHEQTLKRNGREETKKRGTDQRYKRVFPKTVTTKEISLTLKSQGKFNHHIPTCGMIFKDKNILLIPPYTLGAWLGDGRAEYGSITISEMEILDRIRADGFKAEHYPCDKIQYNIFGLITLLKKLDLKGNKRIPVDYLNAFIEDRIELLRGLMDTDGYCGKDSRCEFTTIKKELAEDFLQLVLSLGLRGIMIKGNATLDGKITSKKYRISFVADFPVFHLSRKIARQKIGEKRMQYRNKRRVIVSCEKCESVPVKCIQVDSPSHLYLASKSLIPTHNTELLNQIMVDLSENSGWNWLVFSPESYPHYYLIQNLAEKIIGKGFFRGNERMTEADLEAAINFLNDHIKVIDIGDGEFTSDNMLSLVREYTSKNSIQGLVIDPIGDLEISIRKSENKTYSVARFLRMIRRMGRRKEFSPYIVAHTTKLQKDFKTHKYPVPTLYDIDGSAAYYNSAFQGITTYRYFKADVIAVHVQKIKFKPAGKVGVCFLKYNIDTGVFTPYYEDPEKVEKEKVEQQSVF